MADNEIINIAETQDKSYDIAPVSDRLLAFIIDYLPFFIVPALVDMALMRFGVPYRTLVHVLTTGQVLFFIYAAVFNSGGRLTLGKGLMGLKVVTTGGEELGIVRGVLRSIGYLIGLALSLAGFALAYVTKNKRALHDYMAGSVVISTREKTEAQSITVVFMAAVISGGLIALAGYYMFMAQPAQQKRLVAAARTQVAKIAYLEEVHKQKYGKYTGDIVRLGLISGDAVQFRRDMQKNLRRGGFVIGVDGKTVNGKFVPLGTKYKITAVAKDNLQTKVSIES